MKKLHLGIFSLIIFIFTAGIAFAYQTLAFDFPKGTGNWYAVYHQSVRNETIVQYVPAGQTYENWTQTLILHSYRNVQQTNASILLRRVTAQMEELNSYSKYVFSRATANDAIATRCVAKNDKMKAQCDIFRAMTSFDGYITMQYINRNKEEFKNDYLKWLKAIENAKPYYANFRNDRYMSKESFEL